jgi:hypothetical protein
VGILGAYPTEDELKIILLERMNLNLEEFNRGETYNTKTFNLIIKLEADGTLKDFIRLIIKDKPKSSVLEKVISEFKELIKDDRPTSSYVEPRGRYALVVCIDTYDSPVVEREKFLSCLLETAEKLKGKLCLILSMRADFLGKCVERGYSGLGKKIQENIIFVSPMEREQLREAIALPAKKVKLEVEEALIGRMLNEIEGSPGSLPLLEYTLTRLWEERSENQLKLSIYEKLGGIGGTLDSRATEVYKQFSPEKQQIAKMIFLNLTQLGEGTEDTRRRVKKEELRTEKHAQAAIEKVIQKLADEKLIVTSEQAGKVIIDVAHEALIRHWQKLKKWLEENRDVLGRQRKIQEEAGL